MVIVSGETGSGKSTQLPKFCISAGRGTAGLIGCTQPRRIAASSIAMRIARELGEDGRRSVGYKVRFQDRTPPEAYIKIMTDGILLAETQGDPHLNRYDTIIVDEAHERSLNIDFLLGLLKAILKRRRDLKLIVTSATIDTRKFSAAFNHAPVIEVSGRTFPVEEVYFPDDPEFRRLENADNGEPTHIDLAVAAVAKITATATSGDILVFMPTEQDIRDTCDMLESVVLPGERLMPLFARLSAAEQAKVFSFHGGRKIIVSTNVAETSLTIPGIRYVVDSGLARISRYNPRTRTTALPIVPVSRSSADQRKGRCGRMEDGVCVRLYSKEDYELRPQFTPPEISRSNLAEVILRMMALKLGRIEDFPFVDPPQPKSVHDGFELLKELGAIEEIPPPKRSRRESGRSPALKHRLTKRGRLMAGLPIDPRLSRIIIEARSRGCLAEVVVIAAALSIQDPRERPLEKAEEADRQHAQFKDPQSDFCMLLNLWEAFHRHRRRSKSNSRMKKFCSRHFLSYRRMREWRDIHVQLLQALEENGFEIGPSSTTDSRLRYEAVHKSILAGFLSSIAMKKEKQNFQAAKGREVMIFPGSGLFKKPGEWVVAAEIVETSRLFARTVANIEAAWLEEVGAELCRHRYLNPRWDPSRGEVVATEQVSLFGLLVHSGRSVSYGGINPKEASDIFIRSALVNGDLPSPPPFLKHNQRLIEEIREMEARLRRRDILVSEEVQFRFYRDRLGLLWDVRSLKQKVKAQEHDDRLRMSPQDLMNYAPEKEQLEQFPDGLNIGRSRYPCRYRFDPGRAEDGVTVRIPSSVAPVLAVDALDWLVPGMLKEKIAALLKGLPKPYRKQLVPVSETAEIIFKELPRKEQPLAAALSEFIYHRFELNIPASAWDLEAIPEHLSVRFAVTDARGRVIRSGRDRSILKQDHSEELLPEEWQTACRKWERDRITRWDFGELPESIDLGVKEGVAWSVFPGLFFEERTGEIRLKLFRSGDRARESHGRGVEALYALHFSKDFQFLKKNVTLSRTLSDPAAHFGGLRQVERQIVQSVRRRLFRKDIRTRKDFDQHAKSCADRIIPLGRELLEGCLPVMESYHLARLAIRQVSSGAGGAALSQLGERLAAEAVRLVPDHFIDLYEIERFPHLQRYLKAMEIRIRRAAVHFEKDAAKDVQLQPAIAILDQMLAELSPTATEAKRSALEEFFWMVEEFKVSLFAQELGTAVKVSHKKLMEKAEKIRRMI